MEGLLEYLDPDACHGPLLAMAKERGGVAGSRLMAQVTKGKEALSNLTRNTTAEPPLEASRAAVCLRPLSRVLSQGGWAQSCASS